jgi:hypothetical protein
MFECKYRRGCNRFQVGHGFSDKFDRPFKINILIENFLSLQGYEMEGIDICQHSFMQQRAYAL